MLFNAFKKAGRFAAVVVVPNCCPTQKGGRFAALVVLFCLQKGGRAAVVVVPNCCSIQEGGRFAALVLVPNCPKATHYFALYFLTAMSIFRVKLTSHTISFFTIYKKLSNLQSRLFRTINGVRHQKLRTK